MNLLALIVSMAISHCKSISSRYVVPTGRVVVHTGKFPYLKKDEYEVWAMKMEYWITNNDMKYLEVKARFGGNAESKKMRKSMLKTRKKRVLQKTKKRVLQKNQLTLEDKIRVLSIELENTTNLLKYSERIIAIAETATQEIHILLVLVLLEDTKATFCGFWLVLDPIIIPGSVVVPPGSVVVPPGSVFLVVPPGSVVVPPGSVVVPPGSVVVPPGSVVVTF
ncbi:hypothetical protein Tco_0800371 [Tanacetum coccineum]|uniref:Uncharacterized protein n=1 Tax=Tanacetum coccineum TaxID=301880 RepID=A0ABQ4ZSW3_9ASTR